MSDIVKIYNPANAGALTKEQILGLQILTSPEIKELAIAYPNASMQRAYLLIIDGKKAVEKQLPQLSTFENLWNLREKNGLRQYVAYGFKGSVKVNPITNRTGTVRPRRTEVLDLSDTELLTLPGFRTKTGEINSPKQVEVIKIKSKQTPL